MADRKSQPRRVLIVTGDPADALEVVFTTIYMSVPAVDDTQAALPTRLPNCDRWIPHKSSCGQPEGHQAVWTAWRGELLARLSFKRADVNVKIWKRGSLRSPRPPLSSRPWLGFCWGYVLMAKSPSVWFTWEWPPSHLSETMKVLSGVVPIWAQRCWTNSCGNSHQVSALAGFAVTNN